MRSLRLTQVGATVGQSLGNHVVVASTLKLVRGSIADEVRPRASASLDAAEEVRGDTETRAAIDVGAMAKFGLARFGLTVRNATEPSFGGGEQAMTLDHHFRAGVAMSSRSSLVTVAADFDLTKMTLATGEERRVAFGGEAWAPSRRVGLRAGVSASTIGDARAAASGGASVALRSGTFLEVSATGGADEARRGWGVAVRVTF